MTRLFVAALVAVCAIPNLASAQLVIKNARPCYGPNGPTRTEATCLPRDTLFITYEIEGLKPHEKSKKVEYKTTLELWDVNDKDETKHKRVFMDGPTPAEVLPQLGGGVVPGDLFVTMAEKQAPGKYKIRLIIEDKIGKTAKGFEYPFTVVEEALGFVGVAVPIVEIPGRFHRPTSFFLANLTLDAKTKLPNAEVTVRILDDKGKPVYTLKDSYKEAKDLPEGVDLQKLNLLPLPYSVYMNRPGRFTVEVQAVDKHSKKAPITLTYPLTVLDINSFTK